MLTKSRLRRTRAEKAKIVADFRQSGLSQRDFADQQGIAPSNIQRWIQEFPANESAAAPTALIELPNLLGQRTGSGAYRVHFPQGLQLELAGGFDLGEVRALAQLLHSL